MASGLAGNVASSGQIMLPATITATVIISVKGSVKVQLCDARQRHRY